MDPEYAARYRDLYERHWWWRSRETYIVSQLERLLPDGAVTSILDVGCGDGLMFDVLGRFGNVEGVEIDGASLSESGPWADRIYVQAFDENFNGSGQYGLILMLDALEHMPEPERSLRRAVELLTDDGIIVVTVPAFNALWTSHDDLNSHVERFTRATLGALAEGADARVITSSYFFQWLAAVKLAVRVKETVRPPLNPNPRIPPKWANRALVGLSRAEALTVSRLPIPFGSSLFAVLAAKQSGQSSWTQN